MIRKATIAQAAEGDERILNKVELAMIYSTEGTYTDGTESITNRQAVTSTFVNGDDFYENRVVVIPRERTGDFQYMVMSVTKQRAAIMLGSVPEEDIDWDQWNIPISKCTAVSELTGETAKAAEGEP